MARQSNSAYVCASVSHLDITRSCRALSIRCRAEVHVVEVRRLWQAVALAFPRLPAAPRRPAHLTLGRNSTIFTMWRRVPTSSTRYEKWMCSLCKCLLSDFEIDCKLASEHALA